MSPLRKGDVVTFDLSPSLGHEPARRRPALIVSSDLFNVSTSMVWACPITTRDNGFPLHLRLPDGLETWGWVVTEQMRAFDPVARNARPVEHVDDVDFLDDVTCLLRSCLD